MPKLKILSGKDLVRIFESLDFVVAGQKGSHVKMQRLINTNGKQTLTIPDHKELDKGTLKAIYNQALRYVPESRLKQYFYSDQDK